MRVQVHEARERDPPLAVEDRVRLPLLSDLRDPVAFDVNLRDVALELHVLDQDAHPMCPSACTTIDRVRSAFARCVSRIASNVSGLSTIPFAKLSTVHRAAYGSPSSLASVASEAIVIPTTSPIVLKYAISARVSRRGPVVCTYTPWSRNVAFASFAPVTSAWRSPSSRDGVECTTRSSKYVGMSQ